MSELPREQTAVRLPATLRIALRELAREHRRSTTKEIEHALAAYVAASPTAPAVTPSSAS